MIKDLIDTMLLGMNDAFFAMIKLEGLGDVAKEMLRNVGWLFLLIFVFAIIGGLHGN